MLPAFSTPARIVVADPDPRFRKLYRTQLFLDHIVFETTDGRDAVMQEVLTEPDLIVTELWLRALDGLELCKLIRRDRATKHVPIAVVTSERQDWCCRKEQPP
jgi:two-component system alkaline phosphatase synthesis response regulator PhoP